MTVYILITEPARRTSIRIEVPETRDPETGRCDCDVEAMMAEWCEKHAPETLAEYREYEKSIPDGEYPDALTTYYADATGDDVQIIEETASY